MDLTPEQHVRAMATIQRWVDSSISKTCNVPADYTVAQTRELYELMYELGCKGGTIYRDRSRDEQVLNLENPAGAAARAGTPPTPSGDAQLRPLPQKRFGATVSRRTPVGTAHVTMNDGEDGNPLEVFVEIGRGGSELKAMAEAMGRLMSVLLRMVSALSPKERVAQIVGQLRGIGGSRSTGYGSRRVRSLPDAVAQVLAEHYGTPEVEDPGGAGGEERPAAARQPAARQPGADLCPECGEATLLHAEGCQICSNCGHSEC